MESRRYHSFTVVTLSCLVFVTIVLLHRERTSSDYQEKLLASQIKGKEIDYDQLMASKAASDKDVDEVNAKFHELKAEFEKQKSVVEQKTQEIDSLNKKLGECQKEKLTTPTETAKTNTPATS